MVGPDGLILTRPPADGEEASVSSPDKICKICFKQFAMYTCPRCNLQYCSLSCYKSQEHGNCTEAFYKDSISAEMQSRSVDAGDRTRMLQMLRRFESDDDQGNPYGDSDDEDDVLDMEERLEGLDLSTATSDEILSALTPAERAEFEASLRSGPDALRGYVEIWSPWWERSPDAPATPLVHDMSEEAPKPTKSLVPQPLEGVPPLRKLTSVTPPSDLIFNVVEILGSYAFILRFLNGDWQEDSVEASRMLWDLSRTLSSNQPVAFASVSDACIFLKTRILHNQSYGALPQSAVLALQDTCKLLASRSTILSTLSDVHEIFHVTSSDDPNHHVIPRAMRKRAFASMKKVYFYVALVGDSEAVRTLEELLPVLRLSVEAEVATLIRESGDMQQAHQDAARMTGKGAHGPMVTEFSEN